MSSSLYLTPLPCKYYHPNSTVLGHTKYVFSNIHCTFIAERFRQLTKNNNRIPRTTSAFKAVVETAGSGAKEVC